MIDEQEVWIREGVTRMMRDEFDMSRAESYMLFEACRSHELPDHSSRLIGKIMTEKVIQDECRAIAEHLVMMEHE